MIAIHRAAWHLAALRLEFALVRCRLSLRAYNPGQLRVPAGSPDGGRWTDGDGGAPSDDAPRPVLVGDRASRYGVVLAEEEARGGHTLREHVGKSDSDMLQRVRRERWQFPIMTFGRARAGSFASPEAANDFVNRTLEQDTSAVDAVAEGNEDEAFITHRFGHRTGREAYRTGDSEPYLRDTYSVGVLIRHDASVSRGFRVITAYPRNDGE